MKKLSSAFLFALVVAVSSQPLMAQASSDFHCVFDKTGPYIRCYFDGDSASSSSADEASASDSLNSALHDEATAYVLSNGEIAPTEDLQEAMDQIKAQNPSMGDLQIARMLMEQS